MSSKRKSEYIIVLDDDSTTHKILENFLENQVVSFTNPHHLLKRASHYQPLAVFLDIHLDTDLSGLDLIQPLRAIWQKIPIFIMTSYQDKSYISEALSLGADDFIDKPLQKDIVKARLLKQMHQYSERSVYADISFDEVQNTIYCGDRSAHLQKKETAFLKMLIHVPGMTVTRENVMQSLWGKLKISPNTLDRRAHNLRKALMDVGSEIKVETIYGQGFRISSPHAKTRAKVAQKKPRVLITDDNPLCLNVTEALIEPYCEIVNVAENGLIAEELCQKNSYDIVLMDCQMPIQDGFIATQNILAQQTLHHPMIFAFLGKSDKSLHEQCKNVGMLDIVFKPLSQDDFFRLQNLWVKGAQLSSQKPSLAPSSQVPLVGFENSRLCFDRIQSALGSSQSDAKDFLLKIFDLFVEHGQQTHQDLQNLEDSQEISRKAHRLRGMAANIGALDLEKILDKIENRVDDQHLQHLIHQEKKIFDETIEDLLNLIEANRLKPKAI